MSSPGCHQKEYGLCQLVLPRINGHYQIKGDIGDRNLESQDQKTFGKRKGYIVEVGGFRF